MAVELTEREFSKHLNSTFRIKDPDIELRLVEVKAYRPQENEQSGLERFSIYFDGPSVYLPQSVYSLEHETMGEFEIFLVPISGNDQRGYQYEAVFNYYK